MILGQKKVGWFAIGNDLQFIALFLSVRQGDKLYKARTLVDHMQKVCKLLYQPEMNIALDERMVKAKGSFPFKYSSK